MKVKELLTDEEIKEVKAWCRLFNAQWVEIEGHRFKAPKQE